MSAVARPAPVLGDAGLYMRLDVTSEDRAATMATAGRRSDDLDILVKNAGLVLGKDIEAAGLAEMGGCARST